MKNEYKAVIIGLAFSTLLASIVLMIMKYYRESNWTAISILAFVLVCMTLYCTSKIAKFNAFSKKVFSYILYGTVVGLGYIITISYFDINIDDDSARYMLSALIQSEAAILAIVVSLSLIVIQQAASSYSVRIVDAFKNKNSGLWRLTGIYLFAITYGLAVLMLIETTDSAGNELDFDKHIKIAYYMGVVAFFSLIPYMETTLDLLKPSTVINMLSSDITMQNVLSAIKDKKDGNDENDPIQPIIDIMRSSLMKYDYETLKDGLKGISNRTNLLLQEKFKDEDKEDLLSHVIHHLSRFGRLAANRGDDDSTFQVINHMTEIGFTATKQELKDATFDAIEAITILGIEAAHNNLRITVTKTRNILKAFDTELINHGLDGATSPIKECIEDIDEALIQSKNKLA